MAVLAVAVSIAAVLTFLRDPRGEELGHDEVISLTAATGHQGDEVRPASGVVEALVDRQDLMRLTSNRGVVHVLTGLRDKDVHPPLYFLALRAWMLGSPDAVVSGYAPRRIEDRRVRLLSGLFLLAAAMALLGHGLSSPVGRRAGPLFAAAFLVLGAYPVHHAHNARPYGLLMLLTVLALVVADRALRHDRLRTRDALALGAILGAGTLTHYLFGPLAAGIMLGILCSRRTGALRVTVVAGVVAAALLLPWLVFAGEQVLSPPPHLARAARTPLAELAAIGDMLTHYLAGEGGISTPYRRRVGQAILAIWALACAALIARRSPSDRMLGCALLLPIALPLAWDLGHGARLLGYHRSGVVLVPVLAWVVGRSAGGLLPRWLAPVVLAAALLGVGGPTLDRLDSRPSNTFAAAGQAVDGEEGERTLVIINAQTRGQVLRRIRYLGDEGDFVFLRSNLVASHAARLAAGHDRIALVTARGPCCSGRLPKWNDRHWTASRDALTRAGFALKGSRGMSRSGYALFRGRPQSVSRFPALGPDEEAILLAGDTFLGLTASRLMRDKGPGAMLAKLTPVFAQADAQAIVVNQEGAITARGPTDGPNGRELGYGADPRTAQALADAGVTHASLANNHALDRGLAGLRDTAGHLAAAGITPFGWGEDVAEALEPVVIEAGGARVAVVGMLHPWPKYWTAGWAATEDRAGLLMLRKPRVEQAVERARAVADIVVLYGHTGREYKPLHSSQRTEADWAVEAGVDVLVGHHSHVAQGWSLHRGMPAIWGLGNAAFGSAGRFGADDGYGLLARMVFTDGRLDRIELLLLETDPRRTRFVSRPAPALVARAVFARLAAQGPTPLELVGDVAVLRVPTD